MKLTLLAISLYLGLASVSYCQPANDNYADRIVLTGHNVTFTGDLTGSTVEANEPTGVLSWTSFPATRSVWWSWTATESTPVTIVALGYSADTFLQGFGEGTCALEVYAGTNVFGHPSPAVTTNAFWLDAAFNKLALSFQAVAGTSYQIQFLGVHPSLAVTFQLLATNPPVILDAPAAQTVFPNGSALFTVLAASLLPLNYQWQRNGAALPGATDPMLALDNIAAEQAGAYSVVVSNSTGFVITESANLIVNSSPVQPVLCTTGPTVSNSFGFTLTGDTGRYYRIESSTNLVSWKAESAFPSSLPPLIYPPDGTIYRSVVYASNSTILLSIPQIGIAKFVRAAVYSAANEICVNHLKQTRFAKDLWLRGPPRQARNATPSVYDLQPYCENILTLSCPAVPTEGFSASYGVNNVLQDPVCLVIATHVLEEP